MSETKLKSCDLSFSEKLEILRSYDCASSIWITQQMPTMDWPRNKRLKKQAIKFGYLLINHCNYKKKKYIYTCNKHCLVCMYGFSVSVILLPLWFHSGPLIQLM